MAATEILVVKATKGDSDAFADLVTRYQGMAFAYALATLGDYHLAEDAVQQALMTAYRNLPSLRDPKRFGGWLRGIVRFECLRILRDRARQQSDSLDADDAFQPVDSAASVEEQAELRGELQNLTSHMRHLPERQRVVAQLYYFADQSQAAVAEFLGLSVSTVNNRLREARAALRHAGAYPMSNQPMKTPSFAEEIGRVIRSGAVTIDASFGKGSRPPLLTAVSVGDAERAVTAFISQYLDDDVARLIVADEKAGSTDQEAGVPVRSDGNVTDSAISSDLIDLLVNQNRGSQQLEPIATGIKVIDLFAPLVPGGVVALVGEKNVGKLVLVEELAHRLNSTNDNLTVLVFLKTPDELGAVHNLNLQMHGSVAMMLIPVADASPEALLSSLVNVDTVIAMSGELASGGYYPAIDPIVSGPRVEVAGEEVIRARDLLRHSPESDRAKLLKAYLTQPFFVAEPYTGIPGVIVTPDSAERDLARILDGDIASLAPDALMMRGNLNELN